MALLSNINDKFAVDSTGAIQFNGQVGTSGYILKSNANAAPTWVDPDDVIGGPYLPLTGGTLTGNLAISGSNSLTVGGVLTVGGNNVVGFNGSWNGANMPGSRFGGYSVNGGEIVFQRDNPNSGQMSILVDGGYYAGENNGFYSLYSSSSYNSKAGFYADTSGVLQFNAPATFTGLVSGITPTAAANFVTKAYADGLTPGAGVFLPLSAGSSYPLTGALYLGNVGGDQKIQFQRTGGNVYSIEHDTAQLYFYNRTTTESPLLIQNDGDVLMNAGNVGIGTTSPTAKLEVNETDDTFNDLSVLTLKRVWSTASGSDRSHGIQFSDTNAVLANIYADRTNSGSNYNADLVFITNSGASGANTTEKMRITNAGNVGIGTISPTSKLHVFGGSANTELKVTTNDNYIARLGLYEEEAGVSHGGFIQYRGESGDRLEIGSKNAGTDTVHMSIDDVNGNVGIGLTNPSEKLDVNGRIKWVTATGGDIYLFTGSKYYLDGGSNTYIIGESPDGDNIGFVTGGSRAMTIDENQKVGIGTTSPQSNLHVAGTLGYGSLRLTPTAANGESAMAFFLDTAGTQTSNAWVVGHAGWGNTGDFVIGNQQFGGPIMLIQQDGKVGIGNTSPQTTLHTGPTTTITNVFTARFAASNFFASGGNSMFYVPDTAANIMMFGSNQFGTNQIEFYHKNPGTSQSYVGRISTSGSATSYVTSSDYRLKENIVPISDSISRLNQLKPSRFNFIEEPNKTVDGFLAHEVQDIVPEAIVGEKDEVDENGGIIPQGIDQAKLVPLLVAAIQELEARVKELENK